MMRVLIAIDESKCSEMALQSVLKRRWSEDTEFKILSVFEPLATQCVGWHAAYMPLTLIEAEQELLRYRKELVEENVSQLRKAFGENRVSGLVLEGYAWRTVVEEAARWNADLIIVGSHGRSGVAKFFIGSVAEAIASHANCSVEIIKGHEPFASQVA